MGPLDAIGNWIAHTVQYGEFPQYLTGGIALIALYFAARAANAATEANKHQAGQIKELTDSRAKERDDEYKRQARQVGVWFIRVGPDGVPNSGYTILFANASSLPVSRVEVTISTDNGPAVYSSAITYIPPTGDKITDNFSDSTITGILNANLHEITQDGYGLPPDSVVVSFTDTNGNRWSRNLTGELIELHPDQSTKFHPRPS